MSLDEVDDFSDALADAIADNQQKELTPSEVALHVVHERCFVRSRRDFPYQFVKHVAPFPKPP